MKITNEMRIYEVNGEEVKGIGGPTLTVRSHWTYTDRVMIELDGKTITVLSADLQNAIKNACNHGRL